MRLSLAFRGPLCRSFPGLQAGRASPAVAPRTGLTANLPYPGEADTGLYVGLRGSLAFTRQGRRHLDSDHAHPDRPARLARHRLWRRHRAGRPPGRRASRSNWKAAGVTGPMTSKTLGGVTSGATGYPQYGRRDGQPARGNAAGRIYRPADLAPYRRRRGSGLYQEARLSDNPISTNTLSGLLVRLALRLAGHGGLQGRMSRPARA